MRFTLTSNVHDVLAGTSVLDCITNCSSLFVFLDDAFNIIDCDVVHPESLVMFIARFDVVKPGILRCIILKFGTILL